MGFLKAGGSDFFSVHLFGGLPGGLFVLHLLSLAIFGDLLLSIRLTCAFHSFRRYLAHLTTSCVLHIFCISLFLSLSVCNRPVSSFRMFLLFCVMDVSAFVSGAYYVNIGRIHVLYVKVLASIYMNLFFHTISLRTILFLLLTCVILLLDSF